MLAMLMEINQFYVTLIQGDVKIQHVRRKYLMIFEIIQLLLYTGVPFERLNPLHGRNQDYFTPMKWRFRNLHMLS